LNVSFDFCRNLLPGLLLLLEWERNGTETALLRKSRRYGTELRWEDGPDELLLLLVFTVIAELLRLESELLRLELELLRLLKLRRRLPLERLERTERLGNFLHRNKSWTRCRTLRLRGGFGGNENRGLGSLETCRWGCWARLLGWHTWSFSSDDWSLILRARRIRLSVLISVYAVPILIRSELVIFPDVSATL
jgi:hypothetical protein